ncbi:prepilin-type N-terminal cleavage/methylation domain-containing protein [Simplicispira sedimenti]|uniref:prepilin-type N-terminal cleavage/methylation domain-containing protein n=1 Tax=Simplicispira sedimenti TaxID=2919500 RepID=UPI002432EE15|nr:prepilin-type N-terminal cleavage/methylation domain-containing protein [Acidovorax sp. W1-6]
MSASSWASFAGHLRHRRRARQRGGMRTLGVTLVELMIAVALVGLLAAIAVPSYESYLRKAKIAAAKKDILEISLRLDRVFMAVGAYPASLAALGSVPLDPWGAPYRYLSMDGATVGQKRKDKSLHPLNSDYDLYSMGPDGASQTALTAKASRDDIIRANNGGFVGVAEDY